MENVRSRIVREILSDDAKDESDKIVKTYNSASFDQKAIIDKIFISLCGWSLETLIKGELDG